MDKKEIKVGIIGSGFPGRMASFQVVKQTFGITPGMDVIVLPEKSRKSELCIKPAHGGNWEDGETKSVPSYIVILSAEHKLALQAAIFASR